jgi:hypothetical protein
MSSMAGHTASIYEGTPGTRIRLPHLHLLGTTAEALVATARAEVDSGADRVELCGGVSVDQAAEVRAALPNVSVGLVRYGYESLELITTYKQTFLDGHTPAGRAVFLYLDPDAGPSSEVLDHDDAIFVPVPGAEAVQSALAALPRKHPLGLIELYGGLGLDAASIAWAATRGETPVGFVDRLIG